MSAWGALHVLGAVLIFLATALLLVFVWFKNAFSYWKRRGVEGPEPSIPFGNYSDFFTSKIPMSEFLKRIYINNKDKRFVGVYMFGKPMLIVNDVELANKILGADFSHFESHGPDSDSLLNPLGEHLFTATGKKWKDLRIKLTPAFTSGKMKSMFLIMEQVGKELQKVFQSPAVKGEEVEVKDLVARFTTDIIGNVAFGVECNSLEDEGAPFRRCGRRIFENTALEGLKGAVTFFLPGVSKFLRLNTEKKDVTAFIHKTVTETLKYREENDVKRNDFLDILIRINNQTLEDDHGNKINFSSGLTRNEFMSQVFIFFVAGFETSSGATSFALYELARNPHVQERARQQVRAVLKKHSGQYTYDAMMEMDYLNNIINETLRMYPPLPMLFRKCTETYKVPDSKLVIEKDTQVFIPIIGMHMDPDFFPDPEKFDPDRFSGENRHPNLNKIHMPFGQGPRVCIGQRFGMLQSKVALAKLLDKYTFSMGKNTPVPVKLKKNSLAMISDGDLCLKVGLATAPTD